MKPDETLRCRFCGLQLLFCYTQQMVMHEDPVCPGFLALVQSHEIKPEVARWTQDPVTGELIRDKAH